MANISRLDQDNFDVKGDEQSKFKKISFPEEQWESLQQDLLDEKPIYTNQESGKYKENMKVLAPWGDILKIVSISSEAGYEVIELVSSAGKGTQLTPSPLYPRTFVGNGNDAGVYDPSMYANPPGTPGENVPFGLYCIFSSPVLEKKLLKIAHEKYTNKYNVIKAKVLRFKQEYLNMLLNSFKKCEGSLSIDHNIFESALEQINEFYEE